MSKLCAIFLSCLILVQGTAIGLDDVVQLDDLIEHAKFHKQKYGDNFFVFLSKHYGELKDEHNKKHHEEQEDHEQLPFQYQGHTLSLMAFVVLPSDLGSDFIGDYNSKELNFHYSNSFSSLHKVKLLQPPR